MATLTRLAAGLPGSDRVRAMGLTTGATGARLGVSVNADLSGSAFGAVVVPDGDGYVHSAVTGLSADILYYYGWELDGVLQTGLVGQARTFPVEGAATYSFVAGSCRDSDNAVIDTMRTLVGPDGLPARFFADLGDADYAWSRLTWPGPPAEGVAPDDQALLRGAFEANSTRPRHAHLYRNIPRSYVWSDVDSFGSNCDGTYLAVAAANAAYRQAIPHPDLPALGLYRSWVVGRVRFIHTDHRSLSSAAGGADGPNKSMLGTAQKAWLKDQLLAPEPLKIWFGDNTWIGPTQVGGDPPFTTDTWQAYDTERTELGQFIVTNAVNVLYVHGDIHALMADDGTHNPRGGFPVMCAAPISTGANPWPGWGAPWGPPSHGTWPPSSGSTRLFGWFDVTDDADNITVAYTGWDNDASVARVSMTRTWATPTGPPSNVAVVQAGLEAPATAAVLQGGVEAPATVSIAGA